VRKQTRVNPGKGGELTKPTNEKKAKRKKKQKIVGVYPPPPHPLVSCFVQPRGGR